MKIWIDDMCDVDCDRKTPAGWIGCKTPLQACRFLKSGKVTHVSFDHDLGDDVIGSGYTIARYVEKLAYNRKIPRLSWSIHSSNPVGSKAIHQAMMNAEKFWTSFNDNNKEIG